MSKFRDWIGGLISTIIFLSLALITAICSNYLLNTPNKNYKVDGPTATLSKVLISLTGEDGNLQSQLSAETITYDTNNEAMITRPTLVLFEDNTNPLIVSSETASLNSDGNIIKLTTNVKIKRDSFAQQTGFEIFTENTTFNLNSKTALSDGPVKIKRGPFLIRGVGMKIDQNERSVNILKSVTLIKN